MVDLGLTKAGKEELALAIFMWKELKCQDISFSDKVDATLSAVKLAKTCGVEEEFNEWVKKIIYPIKITFNPQ